MKVSCLQENLNRGLAIVGRAVAARATLPVLSNVMLATDQSRLKLSATNLEISINCWIGAKVDQEGAITVPGRLITDFISSLPPERVDMELMGATQTLNLKCARVEANIKGIGAEEFPLIPSFTGDYNVTLDSSLLRDMIQQVTFAAATDEARPVMTGVLTKIGDSTLTMAAADGFRLSVRTTALETPPPEPLSIIIPARTLNEVNRISGDEDQPIEMTVTPQRNQVLFHLQDIDLISQLIEGTYPAYEQIMPKSYTTRTVIDTSRLLHATRVAAIFARDAANLLRLKITEGRVTVIATTAEVGDDVEDLDATVTGEEIEIAFNANYLMDVLGVINAPQVALETTTPTSPGVIRAVGFEDFTHIVMPMHIAR